MSIRYIQKCFQSTLRGLTIGTRLLYKMKSRDEEIKSKALNEILSFLLLSIILFEDKNLIF